MPFDVKRIFYIVKASERVAAIDTLKQGKHLLQEWCGTFKRQTLQEKTVRLDSPERILILEPEDWHTMNNFSEDCVLLVLASEVYNPEDYIYEKHT